MADPRASRCHAPGGDTAAILNAEVEAVHIATNSDRTASNAAAAAGVPLRTLAGTVVDRLIEACRR